MTYFAAEHSVQGKLAPRNQQPSPAICTVGRATAANVLCDSLLKINLTPGGGIWSAIITSRKQFPKFSVNNVNSNDTVEAEEQQRAKRWARSH